LIAGSAQLILRQDFCRDLWQLRAARRNKPAFPARSARCMCMESARGLTGIMAGTGLVGFGLTRPIFANTSRLAAGVGIVMSPDFCSRISSLNGRLGKSIASGTSRWGK
jgi:hypothetical protein